MDKTKDKSMGKTNKIFNSRMQARLLLVFCVIALLLFGIMGRLIYIMRVDGDRYAKAVLSRQVSKQSTSILPYKRGEIRDRNGTVLARSELNYRLILDPKLLLQDEDCIEPTANALKDNFGVDTEAVQKILTDRPDSQYVVLKKDIKFETVNQFEANTKDNDKIIGVTFEQVYVRSYPYRTLGCDLLGFTSADNIGYYGIEEYYNNELNGTNGTEYKFYDADLNVERVVRKAVNGNSIVSTIDINVQRIIQEQIIKFNTEFGSKNIGILLMNPNNGEILGMATNQEYDLNNPRDLTAIYTEADLAAMSDEQKMEALNLLWKNDAIGFGYEPGSTFKPFTVAAALEEGLATEDSSYYCDGFEQIGESTIHCSKRTGHGNISLGQALMLSCNDALMHIAAQEGRKIFYSYEGKFNFGQKTGVDLPGEESGLLISQDALNETELATSSFGQSFTVTMVQMAAAFSSLVNGGNYYQPHVLKELVSDSGAVIKRFDKVLVKQTVSEHTSEFIQKYMYQTVEAGTAGGAKVSGYSIGGKTGTAQKFPRDAKTYLVSFLGCAPAINPEVVIYVIIDEPQNVTKQADSSIATKFASRILNEVLPALGIYPEGEIDYLLPTQAPSDTGNGLPSTGTNSGQNNADQTGGTNQPDTEQPGTEQPGTEQPGIENGDQGNTQTPDTEQGQDSGETPDSRDEPDENPEGEGEAGQNTDDPDTWSEDEFNPDALE